MLFDKLIGKIFPKVMVISKVLPVIGIRLPCVVSCKAAFSDVVLEAKFGLLVG